MKRLFMTVMAVLSMSVTFAGNEVAGEASKSADDNSVDAKVYDLNYNVRRLAETLGLTTAQMNTVEALNRIYRDNVKTAAEAQGSERKALLDGAVEKDLKNMRHILTPEQFNKYQMLVNLTLANRTMDN